MTAYRYFAGANTAQGFKSFYADLARADRKRVFILKGGPGTGKSTVLRNIATRYNQHYSIDYYHCSADVESLDGIYIPDLDIAVIDGTAPHVIEPVLAGAAQQSVDLGCWDTHGLISQREEIEKISAEISGAYKLAYQWLAMAGQLTDIIQQQKNNFPGTAKTRDDATQIIELLAGAAPGKSRQAFATAITSSGLVDFLSTLPAAVTIGLTGENRQYNSLILKLVKEHLYRHRIAATYFYCPLQPQYLEHIYIPNQMAVISVHQTPSITRQLDHSLGPACQQHRHSQSVMQIIDQGIDSLIQANNKHLQLENIYRAHIDYSAVEKQQRKIIAAIDEFIRRY